MSEIPTSLRERKKTEAKSAILKEARSLFAAQGFEDTTLDEICRNTALSRRTFFRYFRGKEALVFPNRHIRLAAFVAFIKARPPDENLYATLRRGTIMFAANYEGHREQLLAMQALIANSTTLQTCEHDIDREWEEEIRAALIIEFGDDERGRYRARILAGATMGVVRATMRHWYEAGGRDNLAQLGLEALDALQRGFPLPSDS